MHVSSQVRIPVSVSRKYTQHDHPSTYSANVIIIPRDLGRAHTDLYATHRYMSFATIRFAATNHAALACPIALISQYSMYVYHLSDLGLTLTFRVTFIVDN